MTKKRVVVICPGRGSYTRETSNYLSDLSSEVSNHLKDIDNKRVAKNLPKIFPKKASLKIHPCFEHVFEGE